MSRISGIFISSPFFNSRNIPNYIKAGFCFILSLVLAPILLQNAAPIPSSLYRYATIILSELLLGIILGFVVSLIFSAMQMAGQLIDMQIGFGIVNVFDPQSGQQIPLIGNFKYILALLVFITINGHHVLIDTLFYSFKVIPIMQVVIPYQITAFIIDLVGEMIIIALKISLPVLIAIIITDVALGILARTMPQMNIFVVGIPAKIFIGLFVLTLALPIFIYALGVWFNAMFQDVYRVLYILQ